VPPQQTQLVRKQLLSWTKQAQQNWLTHRSWHLNGTLFVHGPQLSL
jgi:hypothetical protein